MRFRDDDLSWSALGPAMAGMATVPAHVIPATADHPLLGPVIVGGAGLAATGATRQLTRRHEGIKAWRPRWRSRLLRLVGAGAAAHTAWSAAAVDLLPFPEPAFWAAGVPLLAGLAVAEWGAARWFEWARTHPTDTERDADQPEGTAALLAQQDTPSAVGTAEPMSHEDLQQQAQEAVTSDDHNKMRMFCDQLFSDAGLPGPKYKGFENLGQSGFNIHVQIPPAGKGGRKKNKLKALDTATHGEDLAVALGDLLDMDIESSWVQIQKTPKAGSYTVTCLMRDALADVHPYVDDVNNQGIPTPRSHKDPIFFGYRADGQRFYKKIACHGQEVGMTQSGKSSLMHIKFAHVTAANDAVQWICGTEKLYDLVVDWTEPFAGTSVKMPIDWIASGVKETMHMLASALRIIRWRQAQRFSRGAWKAIYIQLDEASELFRHPQAYVTIGGHSYSASRIWATLRQTGMGVDVLANSASQRGTQDHSGAHGADALGNLGYGFAFQTNEQADLARVLNRNAAYGVDQPPHPGSFWNAGEGGLELIKSLYMQPADDAKKKLHDGATTRDVAWARQFCDNTLDDGSRDAAGFAYEKRFRFANDDFFEYILSTAQESDGADQNDDEADGADPRSQGMQEQREELEALAQQIDTAEAAKQTPPQTPPQTPDEQDESPDDPDDDGAPANRRDRILTILRAADQPVLSRSDIADELSYRFDDAPSNLQVIDKTLRSLVGKNEIVRAGEGRYTLPDSVTDRAPELVG